MQVSAGESHTCGLEPDQSVACWGRYVIAQTPQGPNRLVFTVQPGTTTAGSAISPLVQVTAQDSAGNTITTFTGNVTVAIGTNPGGGILSGMTTVTAVDGVATFPDLSINKTGNGYTLVATASGLAHATSAAFNITPGPATRLVFTVQPSNTAPFVAIQPPVEAMVVDAQGNTIPSFTGLVTIAIGRNGGLLMPGTLSGTTTVAAVNGHATFSDLRIDQPGSGYTLVVTSSDLTGAESASFDVLAPSLETGVRVTGGSAIGPGLPIPGSDRQEFVFDVTNAPEGRLVVRDYTFVRRDRSVASLTVDPVLDAATEIRSFDRTSPTCATFGGIGRVDTGELVAFTVDACDNGIPGMGQDFFGLTVPYFDYHKSGTLTEGEIALSQL
jgi:hypothetical protein